LVDARTKRKYEMKERQLNKSIVDLMIENKSKEKEDSTTPVHLYDSKNRNSSRSVSIDSHQSIQDDIVMIEDQEFNEDVPVVVKKKRRRYN